MFSENIGIVKMKWNLADIMIQKTVLKDYFITHCKNGSSTQPFASAKARSYIKMENCTSTALKDIKCLLDLYLGT